MQIPKKVWLKYKTALAAVDQKAAAEMEEYIRSLGEIDSIPWSAVQYAAALTDVYGEAAGAAACEMYDATAAASGAKVKPAEMAELPKIGEVVKVVRGAYKNGSEKVVPGAVGRLVKQVGADTTLKNAQRDGAEFAWVPAGDTCAFCLMLASRGWQKISKKSLKNGHAEHIHANCDCAYCVRFDKNTNVEGYDPEKYREMYDNAEGETSKEKINYMRRQTYYTLTENAENANIIQEMSRRRIADDGHEIIDLPTFNKLTNDFVRRGGIVLRNVEAEKHLDRLGVEASYINGGNVAFFRRDSTVSAVLEEMYHAEQDRIKKYGEIVTREVIVRREIDAQEYLLKCIDKYKIPASETALTQKNLERYKYELIQVLEEEKKK